MTENDKTAPAQTEEVLTVIQDMKLSTSAHCHPLNHFFRNFQAVRDLYPRPVATCRAMWITRAKRRVRTSTRQILAESGVRVNQQCCGIGRQNSLEKDYSAVSGGEDGLYRKVLPGPALPARACADPFVCKGQYKCPLYVSFI